jgi:3-phenylpropionate/trans-cinnamate dioxygenase ferredoxin reductase subunit
MIRRDYLIVGAGISGASVCEGIREHDKKGTIMMVGNESCLPYQRPRLFKSCLGRTVLPFAKLQHHDASWFEKQKIDLRLDTIVTQFNHERHLAVLGNGQAVEFR